MIHTQSSKINHYLGLADIYLQLGKPRYYEIEFCVAEDYIPDAYTLIDGHPVVIEYQKSLISNPKMQDKVDKFVKYYKQHGANRLWIYSEKAYNIKVPSGFTVEHKRLSV